MPAYSANELARVRENLGIRDADEARMAAGFFVAPKTGERGEAVQTPAESLSMDEDDESADGSQKRGGKKRNAQEAAYRDRVEMDSFLEHPDFGIKSFWQVFISRFSFWKAPPDKVSAHFINKRLAEHCRVIEEFVTAVRLIFPRNNLARSERLRALSPFAYNVLNVIRHWNMTKIMSDYGRLKSRSKEIYMSDLREILRHIYRPIFILDLVDAEKHLQFVINKLFRVILEEGAGGAKGVQREETTRRFVFLFSSIKTGVRYYLYPLLMKLLCRRWCEYDIFFLRYQREILAFLALKESDRLIPPVIVGSEDEATDEHNAEGGAGGAEDDGADNRAAGGIDLEPVEAVMREGLAVLTTIFPESGWEKPWEFPDMYQYYSHVFSYNVDVEHIDRQNIVMQILILSKILSDLFAGWRDIDLDFNTQDDTAFSNTLFSWHNTVETLINQHYLKMLVELFNYYSTASQFRQTEYGDNLFRQIQVFTKEKILPCLQFIVVPKYSSAMPKEPGIFSTIETLYKYFEEIMISVGRCGAITENNAGESFDKMVNEEKENVRQILYEEGDSTLNKRRKAGCIVGNLEAPYKFDVPTPVTKRLAALIPKEQRTNAVLIRITYRVTAVLHYLLNDEKSWAYTASPRKIFRSSDNVGIVPSVFNDKGINPDNIFRISIDALRVKARKTIGLTAEENPPAAH